MKGFTFLLVLLFCAAPAAISSEHAHGENISLYRLNATVNDFGGVPQLDTAYHLLSEQAADSYNNGDLNAAETYYRKALQEAQAAKAGAEQQIILTANLASVLRDRKKYDDADRLFGRAVEISRNQSRKRQPVLDYVARQYSAFLRKTGRNGEADIIESSAKTGFAKQIESNAHTDTEFKFFPEPKPKKTIDKGSSDTIEAEYTIVLTPRRSAWNDDEDRSAQKWPERYPFVHGPAIFSIDSEYRPLRFECKVPPNTRKMHYGIWIEETIKTKSGKELAHFYESITSPCSIEPISISGSCVYRNKYSVDYLKFELPEFNETLGTSQERFH